MSEREPGLPTPTYGQPLPIVYRCRGPVLTPASFDEQTREWTESDRTPCGEDVSPLINALPMDGGEHLVACPICGTKIGVRRPASANAAGKRAE